MLQHAKPLQYRHLLLLALFVTTPAMVAAQQSSASAASSTVAPEPQTQATPQTPNSPSTGISSLPTMAEPTNEVRQSSGNEIEAKATEVGATDEAAALVIDMRGQLDSAPTPAAVLAPESRLVEEYREAIRQAELASGAYAPALTEHLVGLGTTLQQLKRHAEAVEVFKRGVQLARINSGLYSAEQLTLLRGEILSHMALGDFEVVDERQRYLYRVERRSLTSPADSSQALLRQAQWQREAYLLGIGDPETQAGRLMLSWDLYRMALNETIDTYGDRSLALKIPLTGMMETQYLFAGYRAFSPTRRSSSNADDNLVPLTTDSYRRGESVLKAILEVNVVNNMGAEQNIDDTVALGDWAWWFGKFNRAQIYYSEAMSLIEAIPQEDRSARLVNLFSQPTALPLLAGNEPLPQHETREDGTLVIGFDISGTGRVTNLERLREPEVEEEKAIRRLIRALKKTRFRPPFADGMPVAQEGLVWSFEPVSWRGLAPDVTAASTTETEE
jgi:tetratricopeptide (TPR) repeat protein